MAEFSISHQTFEYNISFSTVMPDFVICRPGSTLQTWEKTPSGFM
jgi:hypothetical protein